MKFVPSRKRMVIFLVCGVGAAIVAYYVISNMAVQAEMAKLGPVNAREETAADRALSKAMELKVKAPDKYVAALQQVAGQYPGTSVELKAMLAEINAESVADARRKEIYAEVLKSRQVDARDRWRLAKRLVDLDEANGWALYWQLAEDTMGQSYPDGDPIEIVVVGMERAGKGAELDVGLLKLINAHPDVESAVTAVKHLARRKQASTDDLMATLEPLARRYPDARVGAVAFGSIRDGLTKAKQEEKLMAFCQRMLGKDAVGLLARQAMADRYVSAGKIDAALALYREGETPDVAALPAAEVGQLADQLAQEVKGKKTEPCMVLTQLAERCVQNQSLANAAELLRLVGERRCKTLNGIPTEGGPADADRVAFWGAYIAFHSDARADGEKQYAAIVDKLNGWYQAQICADLARWRTEQLEFQAALDLAKRAGGQLPKDAEVAALIQSCDATLAKDQQVIERITRLRAVIAGTELADVVDESRLKIAEAQVERKRPAEAVIELEKVWKEHPQSSYAPAALYRASELCLGPLTRPDEAKKHLEQLVVQYPAHELSAKAYALLKTLGG